MKLSTPVLSCLAFAFAPVLARAQSGTLDQSSPSANAGFNGDTLGLTWQAQARAGLSGQLEGFKLYLSGPQNATLAIRLRMGAGWNTTPAVFQTIVTKSIAGNEDVFVSVTSSGTSVAPGTLFVIEMETQGTGCGIQGSYVDPVTGPPLYPEPMFLGGPGCFSNCGWRLAFDTFVLTATATVYCAGDGTANVCPCGNSGTAGNGCASSVNPSGAHLAGGGNFSIANDSASLSGSGMPNATCLYFQGTATTNGGLGAVFGDGLRCSSGTTIRLGTKLNATGASHFPDAGDQSISLRGLVTSPGSRFYQVWYRNSAAFCTPSTFNLSNGVQIDWQP